MGLPICAMAVGPAKLVATLVKVCTSGKQPDLRPLVSTAGLFDHSPFKPSTRLSSTRAGAVQILILVFAFGSAVTYGAILWYRSAPKPGRFISSVGDIMGQLAVR